jgi:tetratricopeptide (TPR) repeat protein
MSKLPIDRYPGARPFADDPNDQRLFYGRDEEIDTLFHRVCAARLLVLFGKSGLGKTSLLQAGVFPKLRERHMLPIPVRLNIQDSPLAIIKISVGEACRNLDIDYTPGIGETLWEFFKTAMFWQGEILLTPVLVFDQFEEIFTLKNTEERATLARELGDLFRGTLPPSVRQQRQASVPLPESNSSANSTLSEQPPNVRVILSLREDFLGALQELAADIPGIFDDRVRLGSLSDKQAERAIRSPAGLDQDSPPGGQFTTPPFAYANDALAEILGYLRGKSEVIEPFQLQLVCRDIEEQVAQQQAKKTPIATITSKELGGRKRLDALVQNFYLQTLAKLSRRDHKYAQRLCEEGLLNSDGFRLMLQEDEILKNYMLSEEALTALVEARLLRKEPRLESTFYELSHDSLARPILDSRPSLKLNSKQRNIAIVVVVILISLSVFGYLQFQAKLARAQQAEETLKYLLNGDRLFTQGELQKAQEAYLQFLALAQQAVTREPDNFYWQGNVSVSFDKLGDVLKAQWKQAEAQEYFQKSLVKRQELAKNDPSNTGRQRDISVTLDKLGDVLNAQGKLFEAQQSYQESLEIRKKLIALDPGNTGWQRDVSVSLVKLGDMQSNKTKTQQYYQDSLAIRQKITQLDPSNIESQRDLSMGYEKMANFFLAQKNDLQALDAYQKAINIREHIVDNDPNNAAWQSDLSSVYDLILPLLFDELNRYREAADIAQRQVTYALKQVDSQVDKQALANDYLALAYYELFNRHPGNAIAASEKGLKFDVDELTKNALNTNLVHGYLFINQYEKAKAIYLNYKDKKLPDGRSFKQGVLDDFKEFRKRGINHPDMKKIEKLPH